MGLEVSSQYLRQADTSVKTEAGPGRPDASAQEHFERVMERQSGGHGSQQGDKQEGEKHQGSGSMPAPSALFESLFSGRMENVAAPLETQAASGPAGPAGVGELVEKLVERILVSEPGKGAAEVRITLGDGPLSGTELSLSRAQDGQLSVRLLCADASSFQTAVSAQDGLRAALERQGDPVRLEISQAGAQGGNEGDSRRRSQGLIDSVPEED